MKRVFKWIRYVLLSCIILTLATVLFLLNSTQTIQWAADRYAPQYGFGYKKISGGLLTGLEVESLTFKDDKLLDSLKIGWNPASIFYNRISLTHLEASGVNVEPVKKVVEAFVPVEPKEDNSSFVLPVTIAVGELNATVNSFEESGIGFKDISLYGEDIVYDGKYINMDDFSLSIDTNVTTIALNAELEEKALRIKKISILDIDTLAFPEVVKRMISINLHKDIVERVEPEIEEYKAGRDHLLLKSVEVDSFMMRVKSADHPTISIDQGEVSARSAHVDIYGIMDSKPDSIQIGAYAMLLDTNLTKISIDGRLKDETITVESLSVQNVDTVALIKLYGSIENNQTVKAETIELDTNSTVSPLLPKYLYVKHLDSSIKSATYKPLFVESAEVNATNVKFNMATYIAESGEVDMNAVSSFLSLSQHGVIKDNHIENKGQLTAHRALFETYGLPQEEVVLDPVSMNIKIDKKQISVDFDLETEEMRQPEESVFRVEHLSLQTQLVYMISEGQLRIENEGNISTPYAKELYIDNVLTLEKGEVNYKGRVIPGKLEGVDANYTRLLNNLEISYKGDRKSVEAELDSEVLKGKFVSAGFKKGDLTFSTKQPLELKNIVSLPEALESSIVAVDVHVPLDFGSIMPFNANAKLRSNLATVDADIFYDKVLKVRSTTVFPEDSLLRAFSPKLNLDALSPLEADLTMGEKALQVDLRSKGLSSQVTFNTENKNLEGNMVLGGAEFLFKGNVEKELSLENSVSSLEGLLQKVSTIYAFDVPPLDGDAKMSLVLTEMKDVALKLNSNTLVYKADSKTEHILNDTMISLGYFDSNLTLNSYRTTFDTQKIFATKPSVITLKEGKVDISPLWINDELKVTGEYDIETQKGEILAFAESLNVSHEMGDLKSRVDVKTSLNGGETAVEGTIKILGGEIYYDMDIKTFSSDSDIVNAEELKKKKSTPFKDNLVVTVKVDTEQPLFYKTAEADIQANVDLMIQKAAKNPVSVLGTVEILKGSSYRFKNKKFVFKKSAIDFTGDPGKPLLDIVTIYKTTESEIIIQITGSLANPNLIFSSIPRMSRKRILSTILFDAQDNDQDLSEDDMMNMMGGTISQSVFANVGGAAVKSAFSSIGINIDNIPFIGRSPDANSSKKVFSSIFSFEEETVIPSHKIHFRGQKHIDEKELQNAMGVDTKSIFAFWKEDKPTIKDKLLPKLEESLRNFYDSKGFYDAEFSIKTSKTDVTVGIVENEPVKIKDIDISSDHDISKLVTFKEGQIFRSKEFVSVKRNIIEGLLKEGYCSYDLDSKAYVDLDRHEVSVRFKLEKGGICTFGKTNIRGLEAIDDSVVLSRVRAREGERFNKNRIQETHDALYDLDAFDIVSVKHDRKFYNVVPIEVEAAEVERPWYFKGDVDYDTTVGLRVTAEVLRTNFMGNAKNIRMGITYSNIDKGVELGYFVPALFKISDYYIDWTSKLGYSDFKYTGFSEEKTYAESFLTYSDEKWNIDAGFAIEDIDISLRKFTSPEIIELGNFSALYPFLRFAYDGRDSKMKPKYGYSIGGMVEYGLPYESEASSYLKYSLDGRGLYTFSDITFVAIAKAGIVEQKKNEIPESKLFFAGGYDTNRAYGYKRVGVIYSPTEYGREGGATMANLTLEANYPIEKNLYVAVFTDNTMLTKDEYDFSGDILSSAGLGVRYLTPIGPIKVDVGMNLHDTSEYALHFQMGQSF